VHYTQSKYYFLWSVIADRLISSGAKGILEIGCGSGQLAHLLYDKGIKEYVGFDFSPNRIKWAKNNCPGFIFVTADAHETDLYEKKFYDAVVCTEFLEHIQKDINVLENIRPGAKFYGSVPNRQGKTHVRYFKDSNEVYERYSKVFNPLQVESFPADPAREIVYFLMEGKKT